MAQVNLDIAKESSVQEVKTQATNIVQNTATNNTASSTGTLSQKLSHIISSLIGSTSATGGSATAGTVMAKLNTIIKKQAENSGGHASVVSIQHFAKGVAFGDTMRDSFTELVNATGKGYVDFTMRADETYVGITLIIDGVTIIDSETISSFGYSSSDYISSSREVFARHLKFRFNESIILRAGLTRDDTAEIAEVAGIVCFEG